MIEKKIEICIGSDRTKILRVRLSLLIVEDGRVLSEQYHSIQIHPGADLAYIRTANEVHLADPNGAIPGAPWPKIPDKDWDDIKAHCNIIHKPDIIEKYNLMLANQYTV